MRREYRKQVEACLKRNIGREILTQDDIKHLPIPVQKYLQYTGVIGKEKVRNMRMAAEADMKLDPQKGWMKCKTEQYNFFGDHPTRLFYIKTKMFGIPVLGLHSYTKEKARMLIKLAGLLTVQDAKGPEMRISDTVTLFNDMCIMAPAALIDKRIQWEEIDDLTARAQFEAYDCKVSAVLHFNEKGELVNFVSDDRYYIAMDGSCKKLKWSTPLKNYVETNGLRLASYGDAVWSLPEGDYCYGKFKIGMVQYNLESFE